MKNTHKGKKATKFVFKNNRWYCGNEKDNKIFPLSESGTVALMSARVTSFLKHKIFERKAIGFVEKKRSRI